MSKSFSACTKGTETVGDNLQAEDRVCRHGQKAQGIMIRRLVADHRLDQRIVEALDKKRDMIVQALSSSSARPVADR